MPVLLTLPPVPLGTNVWYLAYGSNLSSSKFVKDRGITPLATAVVSVPGFTLALESAGFPYQEPSFASIRPIDTHHHAELRKERQLLGTAYLITAEQYSRLIASEGGGIAYKEVAVCVERVGRDDGEEGEPGESEEDGGNGGKGGAEVMEARTLVSVMIRRPEPKPSQRYKDLIVHGAEEANYPDDYQRYLRGISTYRPPTEGMKRLGAVIFLSVWVPLMALMEKITNLGISCGGDEQGNAPAWVVWLVRTLMAIMWWHHDYLHAPLWGRGDGLDQEEGVRLPVDKV